MLTLYLWRKAEAWYPIKIFMSPGIPHVVNLVAFDSYVFSSKKVPKSSATSKTGGGILAWDIISRNRRNFAAQLDYGWNEWPCSPSCASIRPVSFFLQRPCELQPQRTRAGLLAPSHKHRESVIIGYARIGSVDQSKTRAHGFLRRLTSWHQVHLRR